MSRSITARRPRYAVVTTLRALATLGLGAAVALAASAAEHPTETAPRAAEPMAAHRDLARRAGLRPCPTADLDCRAFTGTLAWRPDERRPVLSSRALRGLTLLRQLNGSQRERALRCLAFVAWAEARSDGIAGMRAVIAVVLNRSRAGAYPIHPCAVVAQPSAFEPVGLAGYRTTATALRRGALAPFPRPDSVVDAAALQMARLLVWNMAQHRTNPDPTGGATHFLAPAVLDARGVRLPPWAGRLQRSARIGGHHFFRPPPQVAQAP